jgi:AraC-like DNA-binding protein
MEKLSKEEEGKLRDEVIRCIGAGNLEGANTYLAPLISVYNQKVESYDLTDMKTYCHTFRTWCDMAVAKSGANQDDIDALSGLFNGELKAADSRESLNECMEGLLTAYCKLAEESREKKQQARAGLTPEVKKVIQYIDDNLDDEELKRETITDDLHINPVHLSFIFTQQVGMTLTEYIQNQRLEKAAELLTGTTTSIGDIADKCGYLDQNYFTRIFKRKYGLTPGAYRRGKAAESAGRRPTL